MYNTCSIWLFNPLGLQHKIKYRFYTYRLYIYFQNILQILPYTLKWGASSRWSARHEEFMGQYRDDDHREYALHIPAWIYFYNHNNRSRLDKGYLKYLCVFNNSVDFLAWSFFCRLTEYSIVFGSSHPTVNVWRAAFTLDIRLRRVSVAVIQNLWSLDFSDWM